MGARSFTNLSLYAFGLSGVWTGVGSGILPFKVLEVLEHSSVEILGYGLDKNGALGLLSLIGLSVAAVVQLIAGSLSDRNRRPGKRLHYLLFGGVGMAIITVLFGYATTFVSLLAIVLGLQLFGNFGQGPANALIVDHVSPSRRGKAAGVLMLWRLLGAGIITVIVLQFMANYDGVDAREWMWYSIILMVVVLMISILWTVLSLRTQVDVPVTDVKTFHNVSSPDRSTGFNPATLNLPSNYTVFLIALAFAVFAMSSLQVYALFFLQDVTGLQNPADGADTLVIIIVVTAGIAVVPAGWLSDRIGRDKLILIAGASGTTASTLLLFVSSIEAVLFTGAIFGITVGLFLTLTWIIANDLVRKDSAGKELGYTSIATLVGAASARFFGVGIDELNRVSEHLGYQAMLISVALAFVVSAVVLTKVTRSTGHNAVHLSESETPSIINGE